MWRTLFRRANRPDGSVPARRALKRPARFEQLEGRLLLSARPIGPDFQVSTLDDHPSYQSSVAVAPSGDFVVAWRADDSAYLGSIWYQLCAADGTARFAGQQRVTSATDLEGNPDVAMDADGNFVIVWERRDARNDYDVLFQRFDSAGNPVGSVIQANTIDDDKDQRGARVAMDDSGDFVIVWMHYSGPDFDVHYRSFNADGSGKTTSELPVADSRSLSEWEPDVGIEADSGNFVVTWSEHSQIAGGDRDVWYRLFDADGSERRARTRANTTRDDKAHVLPRVSMNRAGDFAIVWYHTHYYDVDDVYLQQFTSWGNPVGPEVVVDTLHVSSHPADIAVGEHQMVVVYGTDYYYDPDPERVFFRQYALDDNTTARGTRRNVQGPITAPAHEDLPAVGMNARGEFVATWYVYPHIRGRVFRHDAETPGLYDPSAAWFHLKNALGAGGLADLSFRYGPTGNLGWVPLAGDWDFDGVHSVGLYDPATGGFHLKNLNARPPGGADLIFRYGPRNHAGFLPITGDWDGDGTDTVGLYDPAGAAFHLKNSHSAGGLADVSFRFGPRHNAGWIPIAGDWDGDGIDTVGLYDPVGSGFHLKNSHSAGGVADLSFRFGPRNSTFTPLGGDFDRDGIDTVGLYDPAGGGFHLKNSYATGGGPDLSFRYGPRDNAGLIPIMGDWDGPGTSPKETAAEPSGGQADSPTGSKQLQILAQALAAWDTGPADDDSPAAPGTAAAEIDALFGRR